MLKAAAAAGTPRFLHVSTDGVYRYRDLRQGVTEDTPMETHFGPLDYYRRSKTRAEKIARRFQEKGRLNVSIVRPALILGERDAAMLPGVIAYLKSPSATFLGNGRNVLPFVYAGDVADLCILAATSDRAVGQTYNAVNPEHVTQRDLFTYVAELAGHCAAKALAAVPRRVRRRHRPGDRSTDSRVGAPARSDALLGEPARRGLCRKRREGDERARLAARGWHARGCEAQR